MSIITGIFTMSIALSSIGFIMALGGTIEVGLTNNDEERGRVINFLKWGLAILLLGMFLVGLTVPGVSG